MAIAYFPKASVVVVLVPSVTVAPAMGNPSSASVTEPMILPGRSSASVSERLARVVRPDRTITCKDELS